MKNITQIYGIRSVIEAINAEEPIDKIFVQKGLRGDLAKELEFLMRKQQISFSYVPQEKLDRLTRNNHQGVVANISPISFHTLEELVEQVVATKKAPLFLLLDQLSDVRNFGAIIRSAECAGVHGIIIQKSGSAPVTADTIKTSAGAVFNVPIVKVNHLKDAVFYLQDAGISVIAATEKTNKTIYEIPLSGPIAIVMGAEDRGISPSIVKTANYVAKLPMLGEIDSLNVSVASGIFLFETVRQRISK